MKAKTYTSQKDPPEGSREVIERELKRADKQAAESKPADKAGKGGAAARSSGPKKSGR